MCFSYFPRSDPRLYGEKRGSCSGLDVREGRKEVRVFRVATLVLLGHRSLQFYHVVWKAALIARSSPFPLVSGCYGVRLSRGGRGLVATHCTLGWLLAISRGGAIFW